MLVRQGQITEAISYGSQHLAIAEDAFALTQTLFAHGERLPTLQMAAHGLTLEGNRVPLAIWLRDQSWLMGEQMQALAAGEVAFRGEPILEHYLHIAHIAGTQWPKQRTKLLEPCTAGSMDCRSSKLAPYLLPTSIVQLSLVWLVTNTIVSTSICVFCWRILSVFEVFYPKIMDTIQQT